MLSLQTYQSVENIPLNFALKLKASFGEFFKFGSIPSDNVCRCQSGGLLHRLDCCLVDECSSAILAEQLEDRALQPEQVVVLVDGLVEKDLVVKVLLMMLSVWIVHNEVRDQELVDDQSLFILTVGQSQGCLEDGLDENLLIEVNHHRFSYRSNICLFFNLFFTLMADQALALNRVLLPVNKLPNAPTLC